MNVTRRQFFRVCTAGIGGSSIAMMGFSPAAALAEALAAGPGMSVAAFPAVAHATLARVRARGRRASDLEARLRLFWASARGRL